jgi:hypothetical protein
VVKLLVEGSTKINPTHQELRVLACPSAIDLSSQSLRFLAQHLTHRRRELGTRWRKLPDSEGVH